MSQIEATVTLETLCGCAREMKWYGLPPREICVPIKRAFSFSNAQTTSPVEGVRLRRFRMIDSYHPHYRFEEEPEP